MFKRFYYILLQKLYVLKNKNKDNQGKIYMLHKIDNDNDLYTISKQDFEIFLQYLLKYKNIVDIETLIKEKNSNNVVLTFDDVNDSVFFNAYPLLKEKQLPFYLFVNNEFLDSEHYLSFDMIKEMLNDSKAILGCHGLKHIYSRFMDKEIFLKDLLTAKGILEEKFEVDIKDFAFPFGSIYACSKDNIKQAQSIYKNILMTYCLPYNQDYERVLPRININNISYRKEIR